MKALHVINPDLVFLLTFGGILALLVDSYDAQFTFLQGTFILPLIALAVFSLLSALWSKRRARSNQKLPQPVQIAQDWLPFILIGWIYENLHEFTYLINKQTYDARLQAIDRLLFGKDLSLVLERFIHPWLSEFMTFTYALYFVFPTVILILLYIFEQRAQFREFTWAVTMILYAGFLGYVTVPAIGPRFYIASEFTIPLTGHFTQGAAAVWNSLEKVQRDCFPSLHTAHSTVSLIYLWRYRKQWRFGQHLFWLSFPLILSLWFSTLYLRYHWFADVVTGWATAILCSYVAPYLTRLYYSKKTGKMPRVSLDLANAGAAAPHAHRGAKRSPSF